MIRAIIVDDEVLARARLRRLIARLPDVALVGEAADAAAARSAIDRLRPDLVFLDVDLPDGTGFDVARALPPDAAPSIVFVTAYEEFARRAFDADAVDYLLKPYDAERLEIALARVRRSRRTDAGGLDPAVLERIARAVEPNRLDVDLRLTVRVGEDLVVVRVAEVEWIAAADNYVELHVGGRRHLLRESLRALEGVLDPLRFVRIHRATIVNSERVRALRPGVSGDWVVILESGAELKVGRSYRRAVAERWRAPGGGLGRG